MRTVRTVAVALLLAVCVTACGGEESPPSAVGPLVSATPGGPRNTATPVPTAGQLSPPSVPSGAPTASPEEAAAFSRHYFSLVNDAFERSDAAEVRRVSSPECVGCQNLIAAIEADQQPGEVVEGGDFQIQFAEARALDSGDALVDVRYTVEDVRILNASREVVERRPATAPIDGQLLLAPGEQGWVVLGFRNRP